MSYDGPDRRDVERRENVLTLVEEAAELAAQRIASIHRRRLVVQCFLAAVFASAAVGLPIALIANHNRVVASTENAQYNCAVLTQVTGVLTDFIASDAKLRREQQDLGQRQEVLSGFEKLLGSETLKRLNDRSRSLDRNAQRYWHATLLPRLKRLKGVNCEQVLTPSGPDTTPRDGG